MRREENRGQEKLLLKPLLGSPGLASAVGRVQEPESLRSELPLPQGCLHFNSLSKMGENNTVVSRSTDEKETTMQLLGSDGTVKKAF